MSTEFEFFEGTATIHSTAPRVTVRRSGQLVLTEAAVALLGEGVTHVQVGFNAKTRAVGIRAAEQGAKGAKGAYRLRNQPNGRSRLVDARRVLEHHGVSVAKARGLEVEEFGGGVVGFRLPAEGGGGAAAEAEAPAKPTKARRKAAAG